jgi:hypothetical protein
MQMAKQLDKAVKYELLIKPNEDSCWHWPAASDNRSS